MQPLESIAICGISACVPESTLEVIDSQLLSKSEQKTLMHYFGVHRVHKSIQLTTFDLCLKAANRLLNSLQWAPSDIDFVISVTQTPNYLMPSNATLYQAALELNHQCIVFEINSGCTGYVQALLIATNLLQNPSLKKGLILAGETTYNVATEDKSSYPFMGDAGTATAVTIGSLNQKISYNSYTDGNLANAIQVPGGGGHYYAHQKNKMISDQDLKVKMDGEMVKDFIFSNAVPTIAAILNDKSFEKSAIDYYIFHQVNQIILTGIAKKLSIDSNQMLTCFEEYGNTSSASIPLCICHHHQLLNGKSLNLFLSGFGIGMSNINLYLPNFKALISEVEHI